MKHWIAKNLLSLPKQNVTCLKTTRVTVSMQICNFPWSIGSKNTKLINLPNLKTQWRMIRLQSIRQTQQENAKKSAWVKPRFIASHLILEAVMESNASCLKMIDMILLVSLMDRWLVQSMITIIENHWNQPNNAAYNAKWIRLANQQDLSKNHCWFMKIRNALQQLNLQRKLDLLSRGYRNPAATPSATLTHNATNS